MAIRILFPPKFGCFERGFRVSGFRVYVNPKPRGSPRIGRMWPGRGFVVVAKSFSLVATSDERGTREERAGAEWAARLHGRPLLRNPYDGLKAGGWSFTASNTRHVGGRQERQRRFSVSSGEDSGRKEMEGVPSKWKEPCVVSSSFSFRCVRRDDL